MGGRHLKFLVANSDRSSRLEGAVELGRSGTSQSTLQPDGA
jgi:hypothetical protein